MKYDLKQLNNRSYNCLIKGFRITYNDTDIIFSIVGDKPSNAQFEISILLEGEQLKLIRSGKDWSLEDEATEMDKDMISAIGKAISLRYRFDVTKVVEVVFNRF